MTGKYVLGLDFGTLSARALLVNVETGEEVITAEKEYPHGVITERLPGTDVTLGHDWALQDPADYLDVLQSAVRDALNHSRVSADNIIGIGVDFTSCTILPVDKKGNPLCFDKRYRHNPHSWVKLWKHHAAQYAADKLNDLAEESNEEFLQLYGGKISSEWLIPKVMQIIDESPNIYHEADEFMEAGDWIVSMMTGEKTRSACAAGFKACWNSRLGYPSPEFMERLHPSLKNLFIEKLPEKISPIGERAGRITANMAQNTGLKEGTPVAVAGIDAHVALPAMGISGPGKMVLIIGTSTCNILVHSKEIRVPGISGVVKDGVIPGYYGYEAGQAAVGDIFDWFVSHNVPEQYYQQARDRGIDIFQLLTEKAQQLKPGQSGLLALDWLNGNRSTLVDGDLQGLVLGLTLAARPEEIYRAFIEATAFGQNIIVEAFKDNGIEIDELYACGGISLKNPLLMQIYADVMNMPIKVSASSQTVALGSAMFGALAAGKKNGGYDSIEEAAQKMGRIREKVYLPDRGSSAIYKEVYREYKKLYQYFGMENNVMKKLKKIKKQVT